MFVLTQLCPSTILNRVGRDQQNQGIDLNLSLDFLKTKTPLRRTRWSRRRGANGGRIDVGPSGTQKQVIVSEVYLQGLLEQIVSWDVVSEAY